MLPRQISLWDLAMLSDPILQICPTSPALILMQLACEFILAPNAEVQDI